MRLSNYNSNIILPSYNDGFFLAFAIESDSTVTYPNEYLVPLKKKTFYKELSISDNIRIISKDKQLNISKKIRISQNKKLNSNFVLKIKDEYFQIFNTYHFTNDSGFPETDLTLIPYEREIKFKENKA